VTIILLEPKHILEMTTIADRSMEFDYVDEMLIREKTLSARDFDPELAIGCRKAGKLVGFAMGATGKKSDGTTIGYIRLLCIDPAVQRQGIGTALLTDMEMRLAEKGAESVAMMDCGTNYFMPGVDFRSTPAFCFLNRNGYERAGANHNMICEIGPNHWPDIETRIKKCEEQGIEIRRAKRTDAPAVYKLLEKLWPAWHCEVENALENDPPTLYLGLTGKGAVVAFAGYQGNNKSLSWFGPMGTDPSLQGKGVGSLLLQLCLRELARQGFSDAIIPWVGPVGFYARYCDAVMDRCFYAWRKPLKKPATRTRGK
jgi:predicted N-acetyltransferase YhbS